MRYFLVIAAIFLFLTCDRGPNTFEGYKESNENLQHIELQKTHTITVSGSDSENLGNVYSDISVTEDGEKIALFDLSHYHFIILDKDGNVLRTIGREGRGPEEFLQPLNFTFDEKNNLIVYDEAQRQTKIFDEDGNLKDTFNLFEDTELLSASPELFASDGMIYFGIVDITVNDSNEKWKSDLIGVYDYSGDEQKIMGQYDPYVYKNNYYAHTPFFDVQFSEDEIFATHGNSYRIQIFDMNDNERVAYFGFKSEHYKETEEKIESDFPLEKIQEMGYDQSYPNGLYVTDQYIIHSFQNTTEEWNRTRDNLAKELYLTLYDRGSYDFLSELSIDSYLSEVQNDQLYLIEDFNPNNFTIGIYELENNN